MRVVKNDCHAGAIAYARRSVTDAKMPMREEGLLIMKKRKTAVIVVVAFLVVCTLALVGCSAVGSCLNCLSNAGGCAFDCVAKCNTCEVSYYFWSCASFGILCRGCDRDCRETGHNYDDLCISSCYECGELCRSNVSTTDTVDLKELAAGHKIDMTYTVSEKDLTFVSEGVGRGVIQVTVQFGGEDCRYDNVSVTCSIEGLQPSTRWIGTAKSGNSYTVECEFYVNSREAFEGQEVSVRIVGKPAQ